MTNRYINKLKKKWFQISLKAILEDFISPRDNLIISGDNLNCLMYMFEIVSITFFMFVSKTLRLTKKKDVHETCV